VSGLGHGLQVEAWLAEGVMDGGVGGESGQDTSFGTAPWNWSATKPGAWAELLVNGSKVSYPVNVSNGDELQIRLRAAPTYYTTRSVTLRFGNVSDSATLQTVSAPPPPSPPPLPPPSPPPSPPPDTISPSWSTGYPSVQNVGGTSFEIHTSVANESAAAYFVIQQVGYVTFHQT